MKKREGRANSNMNCLILCKIPENQMALDIKGKGLED